MIEEILCALSVRIRVLGGITWLAAITLSACAATPVVDREAELSAAVRRVQVHEAAIAGCTCAAAVCDHAASICDESARIVDADLRARCHQATHACDAQRAQPQECACD